MAANGDRDSRPPILRGKNHRAPSVFTPDALLREARRQKNIEAGPVPEICLLDPDGDIVRHLRTSGRARRHARWACYHTELHAFDDSDIEFGIVGHAVGSAFAVLVAEQLFASGCRLLISMTSAGQIVPIRTPPYFIVIDRALRDEGTSYHYLPATDYSPANEGLVSLARNSLEAAGIVVQIGATWTTDAPFRETAEAIEAAREQGILAVEMEAAALYAFAAVREVPVLCFAHVTNQMGQIAGDFEKGVAEGAQESLRVVAKVAHRWRKGRAQPR
ncbi:MAG: uridine phosphorylase [Rhodospirillales bacterium]|nr:uridine phosphorylase [Rhodospirillales bacterium]